MRVLFSLVSDYVIMTKSRPLTFERSVRAVAKHMTIFIVLPKGTE
jgi:hypothetical protein